MLDKAQIKAAHNRAIYLMGVSSKLDDSQALDMVLDALAAYERVAALRQELIDFMASSATRPKLAIEDVLRKLTDALNGG